MSKEDAGALVGRERGTPTCAVLRVRKTKLSTFNEDARPMNGRSVGGRKSGSESHSHCEFPVTIA